jgi:hypothetical protein
MKDMFDVFFLFPSEHLINYYEKIIIHFCFAARELKYEKYSNV